MVAKKRSAGSLSAAAGFETFVIAELDELGDVTSKRMFGGVGLYCDDMFFGIIARDQLYLKVDARTRPEYEAAGMPPFKPYADRPVTMQYFAVPVGVLESVPELTAWARKAVAVAGRSGSTRTRRPPRPSAAEQ